MSKHTPGPWEAVGIYGDVMAEAPRGAICRCYQEKAMNSLGPTLEQSRANARLIAAAPDLLAAAEKSVHLLGLLVESVGWREAWGNIDGGTWAGPSVQGSIDALSAAIRRARGE